MISKFKSLWFGALLFLLGLAPSNDFVIIDGRRIEIIRLGPLRTASGDVRALDAKSGKELWVLQVTMPFATTTTVGQSHRAALISLTQEGQKVVAYDDQANRYVIDPHTARLEPTGPVTNLKRAGNPQ